RAVDLRHLPQVHVAGVVDEAEADLVGHVPEPGLLVPRWLAGTALEALAEDRPSCQEKEGEQAEAGDPDFEASCGCHPGIPQRNSIHAKRDAYSRLSCILALHFFRTSRGWGSPGPATRTAFFRCFSTSSVCPASASAS